MQLFEKTQTYIAHCICSAPISTAAITRSSIRSGRKMRLMAYTDYTLRTLTYLGLNRDRMVTIQDTADLHGIPKNHLMKVVHQLGLTRTVETVRGRNGGIKLNKEPVDINIGDVVRYTETDFLWRSASRPTWSHIAGQTCVAPQAPTPTAQCCANFQIA